MMTLKKAGGLQSLSRSLGQKKIWLCFRRTARVRIFWMLPGRKQENIFLFRFYVVTWSHISCFEVIHGGVCQFKIIIPILWPRKIILRIFDDVYLYIFSKKVYLRPPAWDLFSSPGAPETKLYFLLALCGGPLCGWRLKTFTHMDRQKHRQQMQSCVVCLWPAEFRKVVAVSAHYINYAVEWKPK